MIFNLNEFLLSVSFALDFAEMDILGNKSNHSKRVAYIAYRIGKALGMSDYELLDLFSLSIVHDNGINGITKDEVLQYSKSNYDSPASWNEDSIIDPSKRILWENNKKHCIVGEENIANYPFYTPVKDVILYHHENFDGTGYFHKKGNEIPLMSQIIHFADSLDNYLYLPEVDKEKEDVINFAIINKNILFSENIVNCFVSFAYTNGFWLDLKNEFIDIVLSSMLPGISKDIPLEKIYELTKIYSNLVDSKSTFTRTHSDGLTTKAMHMADFYSMDKETKYKFMIAARLHDLGKLAISNDILDKRGPLSDVELAAMKKHTYYTRISLSHVNGFEEITEWASNHHEKLDGTGYPYGLTEKELDFNSRLMACLDIYQALTEERPYRNPLTHKEASMILKDMATFHKIDGKILADVLHVFSDSE